MVDGEGLQAIELHQGPPDGHVRHEVEGLGAVGSPGARWQARGRPVVGGPAARLGGGVGVVGVGELRGVADSPALGGKTYKLIHKK